MVSWYKNQGYMLVLKMKPSGIFAGTRSARGTLQQPLAVIPASWVPSLFGSQCRLGQTAALLTIGHKNMGSHQIIYHDIIVFNRRR